MDHPRLPSSEISAADADQLRYGQFNGNSYVYGGTDGDGAAELMIRLDGSHALVSGDFVL